MKNNNDKKDLQYSYNEEQYKVENLVISDLKLAKKTLDSNISIIGKSEKSVITVLKKFFSKPFAVFGLFLFLAIIITSLIVPVVSDYSATKPITSSYLALIKNLPPTYLHGGKITISIAGHNDLISIIIKATGIDKVQNLHGYNSSTNMLTFQPWKILSLLNNKKHFFSLLGTNADGIDIWTLVWVGTRNSIGLALLVSITGTLIGVTIGAYIGFHVGSVVDTLILRVIEILSSVPRLIWFILMIFVMPKIPFFTIFIALITIGWINPILKTRIFVMDIQDVEYVKSAKAIGYSKSSLIFNHILLNVLRKLIIDFLSNIAIVIATQASLSFLSIYSDPVIPNLGDILNSSKNQINHWWYLLAPATIIISVTLSLQLISVGLNNSLNSRIGIK